MTTYTLLTDIPSNGKEMTEAPFCPKDNESQAIAYYFYTKSGWPAATLTMLVDGYIVSSKELMEMAGRAILANRAQA